MSHKELVLLIEQLDQEHYKVIEDMVKEMVKANDSEKN